MTETSAPRNITADLGQLVHKGKMTRLPGMRDAILAPACKSAAQLFRMRITGHATDAPVTCTRPKCQG